MTLSPAQRDAYIIRYQAALLDYTGHVRSELSKGSQRKLLSTINRLRYENGWKPLSLRGREVAA